MRKLLRYKGVILISPILASTLWLFLNQKLNLFIHPRYIVFTAVATVVALIVLAVALASSKPHDEEHAHEVPPSRKSVALGVSAFCLSLVIALSMLFVTPTTLSSSLAQQRDVNSGLSSVQEVKELDHSEYQKFTIKDWANLLPSKQKFDFTNKQVTLEGFIVPIDENSFYLSRFVVYCCAVDASPVGVPVKLDNWKASYTDGQWVQVTSKFTETSEGKYRAALTPDKVDVTPIKEPSDPYIY